MKIIKLKKVEKVSGTYYDHYSFDKEYIMHITTEADGENDVIIKRVLYCNKVLSRTLTFRCTLDDAKKRLEDFIRNYLNSGYVLVEKEEELNEGPISLENILKGNF